MPEVEDSRVIRAPLDLVWDFCRDMANWAPFLKGYQRHRTVSGRESVWTLKGDVGVLARTTELHVTITQWLEKEKVAFALRGLTEPLKGQGTILLQPYTADISLPPPLESPIITGPATRVTVNLAVSAGGITGPMVNALIAPLLHVVGKELAQKLTDTIEELYAR